MRGIAALVVVVNHLYLTFAHGDIAFSSPLNVFINGGAAVTFFFVLSGYVLTVAPLKQQNSLLVLEEQLSAGPGRLGRC